MSGEITCTHGLDPACRACLLKRIAELELKLTTTEEMARLAVVYLERGEPMAIIHNGVTFHHEQQLAAARSAFEDAPHEEILLKLLNRGHNDLCAERQDVSCFCGHSLLIEDVREMIEQWQRETLALLKGE